MKKVLLFSILSFISMNSMAQASGGQIKRNASKQGTTPVKRAPQTVDYSSSGKENGHEYVDLGLSVKWATCNVGANTPSDWGDYFAWGETETKEEYYWETYFDAKDMLGKEFHSYFYGEDGSGLKNISPTSGNDVAREEWGGKWRMPTQIELNELATKCKWIFTRYNNVYGQKITGPSGKSIFLPCSGYYSFKKISEQGSCGWYWSSSLSYKNEIGKAIRLSFSNNPCENKDELLQNGLRYYGGSIRPVLGKWTESDQKSDLAGKELSIKTSPIIDSVLKWEILSVQFEEDCTILNKKVSLVNPKPGGLNYGVCSDKNEYIEDSDSGEKYYIQSSSLGFEIMNNSVEYIRNYYETYPKLPSNVKSINIFNGSRYVVKNFRIR